MLSNQQSAAQTDWYGLQPICLSPWSTHCPPWTPFYSLLTCSPRQKSVASKKLLGFICFYHSSSLEVHYISNDMGHRNWWQKWEDSSHKTLYILCLHGCGGPPVIIKKKRIIVRGVHELFHKGFLVCWLGVPRSEALLVSPVNDLQKDKQNELLKQCWHVMKWKTTAVWPCLCFPFFSSQNCAVFFFFLFVSQLHFTLSWMRQCKLPCKQWLVRNAPPALAEWLGSAGEEGEQPFCQLCSHLEAPWLCSACFSSSEQAKEILCGCLWITGLMYTGHQTHS